MALTVTFYKFTKRSDSTARPAGGTSFGCVLKTASSVIDPVIELDTGTTARPDFNYAYIPDYGRYYWISDWTWISNRLWEASMTVDILATYKNEIGNTPLYVLRSSGAWNGNIIDNLYPYKTDSIFYKVTHQSPFFFNPADTAVNVNAGTYVVGIAGPGYTQYVGMSRTGLNDLMTALSEEYVTVDNDFSEEDASLALQRALVDPFQYIKSCKWFPVVYEASGTVIPATWVGDYSFPISHTALNALWRSGTAVMAIPKHSQAATRGAWLNAAAMRYELVYGPFGKISLDPAKACNYSHLVLYHHMDFIGGNAILEIGYSDGSGVIQELDSMVNATIGVDIQLSQVYHSATNRALVSLIGKFAKAKESPYASINQIFAKREKFINSIGDVVSAMGASLDTIGGGGGFIDINLGITLYAQELNITAEDIEHSGRPLCEIRTIGSLGGFNVVQNGDIAIPGTKAEHDALQSALESGIYYE